MNQRTAGVFLAVVLLIALGIVLLWCTHRDKEITPGLVAVPDTP